MPTTKPVINGVAPSVVAKGLMIGNCVNKSKKEKKIIIYTKKRKLVPHFYIELLFSLSFRTVSHYIYGEGAKLVEIIPKNSY